MQSTRIELALQRAKSFAAKDEFACTGVRGVQGMRRSRSRAASTSSLTGKARNKVRAAKDYLDKNGMEGDVFATTLLKCTASSFGMDIQLPALNNKLKPIRTLPQPRVPVVPLPSSTTANETPKWTFYCQEPQSYEDLYNMSMGEADDFDGKSCKAVDLEHIMNLKKQNCRRFFCKEISTYEEFYNLVGDEQEEFDDQKLNTIGIKQIVEVNNWYCRQFYCRDIFSYEELFNLVGDDQGTFDDEHLQTTDEQEEEFCGRHYYGSEIHSYEEFYNLVGGDDDQVFDDEVTTTKECRTFYGREIESYEDFYNLVGGGHEHFDDEQPKMICQPRQFYCKEIQSYEEFFNLVGGDHEEFDDFYA